MAEGFGIGPFGVVPWGSYLSEPPSGSTLVRSVIVEYILPPGVVNPSDLLVGYKDGVVVSQSVVVHSRRVPLGTEIRVAYGIDQDLEAVKIMKVLRDPVTVIMTPVEGGAPTVHGWGWAPWGSSPWDDLRKITWVDASHVEDPSTDFIQLGIKPGWLLKIDSQTFDFGYGAGKVPIWSVSQHQLELAEEIPDFGTEEYFLGRFYDAFAARDTEVEGIV